MRNKKRKQIILVVDDEQVFVDAVRDFMESDKLDVLTANSLKQAQAVCATKKVDVVLLDHRLPDGDGYKLGSIVEKNNKYAKIIYITAFPSYEIAIKALRIRAFDFLSKPLDLEELRLSIETALLATQREHYNKVGANTETMDRILDDVGRIEQRIGVLSERLQRIKRNAMSIARAF